MNGSTPNKNIGKKEQNRGTESKPRRPEETAKPSGRQNEVGQSASAQVVGLCALLLRQTSLKFLRQTTPTVVAAPVGAKIPAQNG